VKTLRTNLLRLRSFWQRRGVKRKIGKKSPFHFKQRTRRSASLGEAMWQDVRFGLRMLRKNTGFALMAVLTLALGIGANIGIFAVVNAVLLRPLPYPDPDRLVQICRQNRDQTSAGIQLDDWLGGRELEILQDETQVLSHLASYAVGESSLSGIEAASQLHTGLVSDSFLTLLGVRLAMGRNFLPEENQPGAAPVAILSHATWQRCFQSDAQIIGRSVTLNRRPFTIVGVLPASFRFIADLDVYVPLAANDKTGAEGLLLNRKALGRLQPGVFLTQAQAALDNVYQRIRNADDNSRVVLAGFQGQIVRKVKLKLLVFLGAVGLVLLIACANIANLLLARSAARRREMAVRAVLGAGRWRLVRQLLAESVLLALLGTMGGGLLAQGIIVALGAYTASLPGLQPVVFDARVLGFTLVVTLLAGSLCGLAPALTVSQPCLADDLKEGASSVTGGRRANRLRHSLVVLEMAMAMVLVCGAGLLAHSFFRLSVVDLGYQPERLLTFTLNADPARFPNPRSRADYCERMITSLRGLAGVETVGANTAMPLIGYGVSSTLLIEGRPQSPTDSIVACPVVNGDYFRALGIPVRHGRALSDLDREGAPEAVVVNESVARRHFPDENPIGKRILVFLPQVEKMEWKTIVGVVEDTKLHGPEQDAPPQVYLSYLQVGPPWMTFALRTRDDPLALADSVRRTVRQVDENQRGFALLTMEQRLTGTIAPRKTNMLLLGLFAAVALVMATVGLYGVVAFSVGQRTHEIGIRMALGAHRGNVLGLVVRAGLKLALAGIVLGLVVALALTRVLGNLLFGVTPNDPLTIIVVSLLLLGIALLACWLPARRAARMHPMVALRCE